MPPALASRAAAGAPGPRRQPRPPLSDGLRSSPRLRRAPSRVSRPVPPPPPPAESQGGRPPLQPLRPLLGSPRPGARPRPGAGAGAAAGSRGRWRAGRGPGARAAARPAASLAGGRPGASGGSGPRPGPAPAAAAVPLAFPLGKGSGHGRPKLLWRGLPPGRPGVSSARPRYRRQRQRSGGGSALRGCSQISIEALTRSVGH